MDSRMLHRAERAFGYSPATGRWLQTFFFDVKPFGTGTGRYGRQSLA